MDINALRSVLKKAWCKETCYEKIRDKWGAENLALGQCYVTTLIVNDHLGGEILKARLSNGITHYWNKVDGEEIDLTKSQFKENELIPKLRIVDCSDLIENERYSLLKSRVIKSMAELS